MNASLPLISDVEIERFREICRAAWITGKTIVTCEGPGAARRTRQKFYRIRSKLPSAELCIAEQLMFHLNGCQIEIIKKANYTTSLSSEEPTNAPVAESLSSPRN